MNYYNATIFVIIHTKPKKKKKHLVERKVNLKDKWALKKNLKKITSGFLTPQWRSYQDDNPPSDGQRAHKRHKERIIDGVQIESGSRKLLNILFSIGKSQKAFYY